MAKRNLIITAVVLVAIAYSVQYFKNVKIDKTDNLIGKVLINAELFESVDQIRLSNSDNSVTLSKIENDWIVQNEDNFPVNMEKLIQLMEKANTYKIASIITKDSNKLSDFKVLYSSESNSEKKGIGSEMLFKASEKELAKLVLGKERTSVSKTNTSPYGGAGGDGTYVRIGNKKVVYIIKDNFSFDTDPKKWIQTDLFKVEKEKVKKIEFKHSDVAFSLVRAAKNKQFEMPEIEKDQKLKNDPESGLLNDLSDFSISDILIRSQDFEKNLVLKAGIIVTLFDDSQIKFSISEFSKMVEDKTEQEYYILFDKSQKDYVPSIVQLNQKWLFKIEEWKVKKWLQAQAEYYQKESE